MRSAAPLWVGLALSIGIAQGASAADKGMSGDWTLDFDQSENLGPQRLNVEMTVSIDGDNLTLRRKGTIEGREEPFEEGYTYQANGAEHTVTGAGGNSRAVRASWTSDKLKVTWDGSGRLGPYHGTEVWQIKNNQIYIKTTFEGVAGSFVMKSYYDRKKPPAPGG